MKPSLVESLVILNLAMLLVFVLFTHHYDFKPDSAGIYRCNNWTGEVSLIGPEGRWITIR